RLSMAKGVACARVPILCGDPSKMLGFGAAFVDPAHGPKCEVRCRQDHAIDGVTAHASALCAPRGKLRHFFEAEGHRDVTPSTGYGVGGLTKRDETRG